MATVDRIRGAAKVLPNSTSLEEARRRTIDFFKKSCRVLPAVMDIYNLHDVVTVSQLRTKISTEFRKNAQITNPKVIDMLIFKGEEELTNVIDHAKQRHHIIGQYVLGREGLVKEVKEEGISDFLKKFYKSNYF